MQNKRETDGSSELFYGFALHQLQKKKAQTDTHTTNVYSSGIKNTMRKQKRCDGNQNAIGMKKGKRKKDERVTRTTTKN